MSGSVPLIDCVDHIQGENCHHRVKLNSQSRSNNKETAQQLGNMDYIDFQVRRIADELQTAGVSVPGQRPIDTVTDDPPVDPTFDIAKGYKSKIHLQPWTWEHRNDPALEVTTPLTSSHMRDLCPSRQGFVDLLNGHLRDRLSDDQDADQPVFIKDDTLYEHPLFTINYTSYDLRRDHDAVHLKYGSEGILVYSPTTPGPEPWLYARVVAIYHVLVYTRADPVAKRIELLWVRWMQREASHLQGPNISKNYTRVSFVPQSGIPGEAFGFVDPSHVIRGCHLLPIYALDRTRDLLSASMFRHEKGDWRAFYANR